ncbi:MAG: hypothetical protein SVR04_16125 [Spirochaetota bacterium]|nr:hypothetical protein [Spirochaetota bacterium]
MRYFLMSLVTISLILYAASALAQWEGPGIVDDREDAFQDRIERNEETKAQVESTKQHVAPHPGPEGSPAQAKQLLQDRLEVLKHNREIAVQQKKPAAEIAKLDAQIKDLQEQLTAY